MHTFSERIDVGDCRRLLSHLDPVELLEYIDIFPLEKINIKRGSIEIIYIHNPRARFGGKAKVKVTVTHHENTLRIHGLGPISFELRLACTTPSKMLVYLTVTGKLIDKVPKAKVGKIFERLKEEILRRAGKAPATKPIEEALLGGTRRGEKPVQPPAAAAQPATLPPTAAPAPAAAAPAAPLAAAPAGQQVQAPGFEGMSMESYMCMVRLITAGFPVDDELSRRIPVEYSHRIRTLPIVANGYDPVERIDLLRYDDADYLIRLVSGDVVVDVVRMAGRVGVYYRDGSREAYGVEAARLAAEQLCRPGRRIAYTVARLA